MYLSRVPGRESNKVRLRTTWLQGLPRLFRLLLQFFSLSGPYCRRPLLVVGFSTLVVVEPGTGGGAPYAVEFLEHNPVLFGMEKYKRCKKERGVEDEASNASRRLLYCSKNGIGMRERLGITMYKLLEYLPVY